MKLILNNNEVWIIKNIGDDKLSTEVIKENEEK